MDTEESLVPVFMPSLASVLVSSERRKGSELTYDEVIEIRDKCVCVMVPSAHVHSIEESRGYRDLDPENCWEEWQQLRAELAASASSG